MSEDCGQDSGLNKIVVRSSAWYDEKPLNLAFPRSWEVTECRMAGHNAAPLGEKEVAEKLSHPIGTPSLQELARGRRECAIIVDDLTRPTKAWKVLPAVLDELHKSGLTDSHIRFVMGLGAHHFMLLDGLIKKLGKGIPDKFYVFNHNIYENNVRLGETSFGTSVAVNKEVMECDLKIAIGGILPHMSAGFGGGGKSILPGVSSVDTIEHNHRHLTRGRGEGRIEGNEMRLDIDEASRMAGLDFIVNCIFNSDRDWCDLVCGDIVEAHRAGVRIARKNYLTKTVQGSDIVVVNGYPMESEAYKVFSIALESVRSDGDIVVILRTPEGARGHYYNGRFGINYGGRGWTPDVYLKKPWKMRRVIVVSPHHSLTDECYYGMGSQWVKSWPQALRSLYDAHDREGRARVVVYPYAPMQISEKTASYP